MKTRTFLIALLCILMAGQSCTNKPKEGESQATAEEQAVAEQTKKQEALVAKRARIEKARLEIIEKRRIAALELSKNSLTFTDSNGKLVYNKAETDPSYFGGEDALAKYLKDNLVYPQVALDKGVEGTVFVDFVVDEKGKIAEVEARDAAWEDVDQSLMDEATRIVKTMPNWVAGSQRGKPVSTKFSIPITFQLSN